MVKMEMRWKSEVLPPRDDIHDRYLKKKLLVTVVEIGKTGPHHVQDLEKGR